MRRGRCLRQQEASGLPAVSGRITPSGVWRGDIICSAYIRYDQRARRATPCGGRRRLCRSPRRLSYARVRVVVGGGGWRSVCISGHRMTFSTGAVSCDGAAAAAAAAHPAAMRCVIICCRCSYVDNSECYRNDTA